MKRFLLIVCLYGVVIANEPPVAQERLASMIYDSEGLRLVSPSPALPKSPPLTPLSRAKKPLKMVTVSVNVWHNDPCDEDLWNQILEQYYQLKNAPFSSSELFAGITAFIKLTEEKKGNALWGGLSFTEVPDSQRIDNKKTPEKP